MRNLLFPFAAILLLGILVKPDISSASGFALPDQSASAMGMASAFTGQADDPTAVWYNPAGITQLEGSQAAGGVTLIYPSMKHENGGITEATKRKVHTPIHLFSTGRINDRLSWGLGITNPFGLSTDWSPNSITANIATFSEVTTFSINPNIAYRISDTMSVALGIDYLFLDATMEKDLPPTFRLAGDGDGLGANVAVLHKATEDLNMGLSYRSRIKVDIEGDAEVVGVTSNPATTKITLPDIILAGISYRASDALTLNANLDYTLWSTYDRLVIKSNTILALTSGATDTSVDEKKWNNTWCFRLGGQYRVSDRWKLRAGLLYDQNPVPDEHFDTVVPDSDRMGATLGTGYTSGNLTIDASYMYLQFVSRTINDSLVDGGSQVLNGDYKSTAHLASVTVGYRF